MSFTVLIPARLASSRLKALERMKPIAAIETPDPATLTRDLRGLLTQPLIARRIGEAALTYAERQGAVLDEALALLKPLLPA